MNKLTEEEMFSITENDVAYPDCKYCLCRMCMYLRSVCKNCYVCEFRANVRRWCMWFVPYVFRRSPYQEWFRELEKLRIRKYRLRNIDLLDFKG